jgi:hypothetical protein
MINNLNIRKIVYGSLFVFVCLYFLSALLAPVDQASLVKYHITVMQVRFLIATILLPVVGIWVCAAYGFVHFKQYALSIKGTPHSQGTNTVANGLGIIALQLFVSAAISILSSLSAVKSALGGVRGVTLLSTSSTIACGLIAAFILYRGAIQLNASLARPSRPASFGKSFYVLLLISVAFLIAIVLAYPVHGSSETIYKYVPLEAAIVSIWAPYVVTWNLFLLAARNLRHYNHHAKGKVYKQTFSLLTTGVFLILSSSVFVQLLGTFSEAFSNVTILPLIIIIYVLLAVIAIGYLCIARAATQLRRVEE